MYESKTYPRRLRAKEWDLLRFVLPSNAPGYREVLDLIGSMTVLAEGRRGKGNFVLGFEDDIPDVTSPLTTVIAFGMVETTKDIFPVTVREVIGEQIDVEIVSAKGEELPDHFEEKRRWTYSTWRPGQDSPATSQPVREVSVRDDVFLALARYDRRIWVHDAARGMNLLVPITNFYNELMLCKGIRDPKIALRSGLLFEKLDAYSDKELVASFIAYNKLRPKVSIVAREPVREMEQGFSSIFKRIFRGKG